MKNDLAAVYGNGSERGQHKQEGKEGHDNNIGLTWEQQGNRRKKREGDRKEEKLFTG